MILLIDGYNLIKQALGIQYVPPEDMFKFLQRLNSYASKKSLKVDIVFDGYNDELSFSSSRVKVLFSGHQESADDLIKSIAVGLSDDVLLISSDRELCNFVENDSKLEHMDSLEFYSFLKASESQDSGSVVQDYTVKTAEEENLELDNLMEQSFGVEMKAEDFEICSGEPKRHKTSKNDKRILKKIRKL
jgi:predicted RNA-binding protein with PIN domain